MLFDWLFHNRPLDDVLYVTHCLAHTQQVCTLDGFLLHLMLTSLWVLIAFTAAIVITAWLQILFGGRR